MNGRQGLAQGPRLVPHLSTRLRDDVHGGVEDACTQVDEVTEKEEVTAAKAVREKLPNASVNKPQVRVFHYLLQENALDL